MCERFENRQTTPVHATALSQFVAHRQRVAWPSGVKYRYAPRCYASIRVPLLTEFTMHKVHSLPSLSAIGTIVMALAASVTFVTEPAQARGRNSVRDGEGNSSTTITRADGGTVTRRAIRNLP